jgi:hypothetical protein
MQTPADSWIRRLTVNHSKVSEGSTEMANRVAHQLGAALVVGGVAAYDESSRGESTAKPLMAALMAGAAGKLPDQIEPAIHPHHRQFFHSWIVAGGIGYAMYRLYRWKPETEGEKLLKGVLMVLGGAYLTHLAMDSVTCRSLPLLGKI